MHIAFVYFNAYEKRLSSRENLKQWFSMTDWSTALINKGLQVSVFFRCGTDERFPVNGADYYAFSDHLPARLSNRHLPVRYLWKIRKAIRRIQPSIIHAHDLNAVVHNLLLRWMMPSHIPMVIQDHASLPNDKYGILYRLLFQQADALLFSAPGQETDWVSRRFIPDARKVRFIMENATSFKYQERQKARQQTAIEGDPVFLWVGNLTSNKDPLTILRAFNAVLDDLKDPVLIMVYRENTLEKAVREYIRDHPRLLQHVDLRGPVPRSEMEWICNSADYFLLGSHKEGSGYALMEAMACGVIPIVTKIPSFESLLGDGAVGKLWHPGASGELIKCIRKISHDSIKEESRKVRAHFNQHFSFEVLAERAVEIYRELIKLN